MPRIFHNNDQKFPPALQEILDLADSAEFCKETLAVLADKIDIDSVKILEVDR